MVNFRDYAKYYNLLYTDKNYQAEVEYVDSLIKKFSKKKVKTILDLGCGTGKHAFHFADRGYQVDGIDLAKEMITIARTTNKYLDKIKFRVADARHFNLKKKYDAVVSLFHVINYQITNDDLNNTLKCVYNHLNKKGVFIFDCWYGPAVLIEKPSIRVKRFEDKDLKITRTAEPIIYPNENLVDVNYQIIIINKKTKRIKEIKETHRVRYLFKPELELFLKNNGFEIVNFSEFMTNKKPGFATWGVGVVARKK